MEPFDAPKPQHEEETEAAWPPGMPDQAPVAHESNGTVAAPEPAASWPPEMPEAEADPEPEPAPEPELAPEPVAEADASEADTDFFTPVDEEPAPVEDEAPAVEDDAPAVQDEPPVVDDPDADLPRYDADNEDEDAHEEAAVVGATAVTAAVATDEPSSRRLSLPSLSKLRDVNVNVSLSTFEPRVIALIALLAVVAAVGLIVMRNRSTDDTTTPQASVPTKNATPSTPTTAKPTTPTGFTHVAVDAGSYSVDVPTALQRQVNGALVTFSAADKSRAYSLNGKATDDSGLNAVAKRLLASYRDTYRLTSVKVDRSGTDVRITAAGRRRGGTSRQDIFTVVFRGKDGQGTFVLQRFTPRGKTAPEDELNTVLGSVTPAS